MLQTELEFTLPCGYVDTQGTLHRRGVMRRATALDEVEPLGHPRVRANEAYLSILLLGRVVVRLGTLPAITPEVIEGLFATDFTFLQDLYARLNGGEPSGAGLIETQCPACGTRFVLDTEEQHG
jgi:hypothetical protein